MLFLHFSKLQTLYSKLKKGPAQARAEPFIKSYDGNPFCAPRLAGGLRLSPPAVCGDRGHYTRSLEGEPTLSVCTGVACYFGLAT